MAAVSLPQFTSIDIDTFAGRLAELLQSNLQQIDALLTKNPSFTWDNLMHPLEDMDDKLEQFWSPIAHLHAVVNSPALRECYQACLPKFSAYEAAVGHNQALYNAIKSINKEGLDKTQHKIIEDSIRDFELSGVALSAEHKKRFEAISARLSKLSNQFENNVLDSSQAYNLHITDEKRLAGLPEHAIDNARTLAEEKGLPGWVLNLEIPCYLAVVTHADDRSLREEIYKAYVTRASDQGAFAEKYNNSAVMDEMLALRHEKANLLGFANYAELSLATKMAESTEQVVDFLSDLSKRAHHQAEEEFGRLQAFAKDKHQIEKVAPWDVAYLSEKKMQFRHAISQEELRPYFPLPKVMDGLFTILKKLYGMTMEEVKDVDIWHPDVACYRVLDQEKNVRGYLYADLFARQNKRGGAWMDSCQSRRKLADGSIQLPIATLTCNFAKPSGNKTPTLSHDEVITLFHELGHCLHHVLTQVDYLGASGISGVEWDAVELPSQFFENWCWEEEALQLLTSHVKTGEVLPLDMFKKVLAAKNFQSAMGMMRQLEFSLFDFRIHREFQKPNPEFIASVLADVRKQTAVVPIAPYNRFQHSFSHIFGGGYAAGYYSYKWAEVLSSDAFSRFEEEGVFNAKTGQDFLHQVLEVGGSRKAIDAFVGFRGRPAKIDALLRHNGIQE
jgi:oligopeptidase A